MKLMLHTGSIDYETFYNETRTNPIEQGKVYDISTPEKEQAAKVDVLRSAEGDMLVDYPRKPKEPVFTLAQMKDTERVAQQAEKYEADLAQYNAQSEVADTQVAFFEALESGQNPEVSAELVDDLFKRYVEYHANEYVPRIYYYDLAE